MNRHASASSQVSRIHGDHETGNKGHIMISYSRNHQECVIAIRDFLRKQGYDVWMDIDNMYGSTLQAMAEAVEGAHVVLICISQAYKDSENCRDEAEYARTKRKIIFPLKMERGYLPDGWLGLIVGNAFIYDFSGKNNFDAEVRELHRAIANAYAKPLKH